MVQVSRKIPQIAAVSLCLLLGAPVQTFAGDTTKSAAGVPGNPASVATQDAIQTEATAQAQLLDEEEMAELSQRNQDPGPKVRGGALSNEHLTYIVIALAAIVLVLVLK